VNDFVPEVLKLFKIGRESFETIRKLFGIRTIFSDEFGYVCL
jgi:hypothetical protein